VPGSLSGLAAWAAETAAVSRGWRRGCGQACRGGIKTLTYRGKHSNRLALLLGSSRTAAGTPETGSYVLTSDLNPHEQKPGARTQPSRSQAEVLRGHGGSPRP
jgi:hypothetical protein